jgi:hypothetical protein
MIFSMFYLCRSSVPHIVEHSNKSIYLQWTSPQRELPDLYPFIPELQLQHGRVFLYFLVPSGVGYLNSTNDPWFSATTEASFGTGTHGSLSGYIPDEPATVLGCAASRKICNPKLPAAEGCIELWSTGEKEFVRMFPDAQDRLALRPLFIRLTQYSASGIHSLYMSKGVPNLLARETLEVLSPRRPYQAVQTKPFPSDQWQKEIEYVSQATLAAMQHSLVDYARGSWLGGVGFCGNEPCRRTCHSQVC